MNLPQNYSTKPDSNGIYEKITFERKKNRIIKTTQKIKQYTFQIRKHKRIKKRQQNMFPFGRAKNKNNDSKSFIGEEIFMQYSDDTKRLLGKPTKSKMIGLPIKSKSDISKKQVYKLPKFTKNKSKKINLETNKSNPKKDKYVPKFKRDKNLNEPINKKKLIIRNLQQNFMEDDLAKYILKYGKIKDIRIIRDRTTGISRGFGFIFLYSEKTAQKIINNLNGKPFGSMIVNIKFAETRKFK